MDEKQGRLQWWMSLKGPTQRLIGGMGIVITVLSGVVGYKEVEKNRIEAEHKIELNKQTLAKEQAQEALRISSIKCAEDKAAVAQKALDDSKERVSKLEELNSVGRETTQQTKRGVKQLSTQLDKISKGVAPL